jgi:hypothetical protein
MGGAVSSEVVDVLVARAEDAGVSDLDLDEAVHEVASRLASEVNNGGVRSQVAFLVDRVGVEAAGALIDEAAGA